MTGTNVTLASTKGISTLVRPKFGPGMLLHHEDLELLGAYSRDLSRLMFRSLFGCGVICGLKVTTELKCGKLRVSIESGLALTCSGDPVHVPKTQTVAVDLDCESPVEAPLWVILCGSAKNCAPRASLCADDEDTTTNTNTRERAAFEIRVLNEWPECVCGSEAAEDEVAETACLCADPSHAKYQDHYAGVCGCGCCDCSGGGSDCVLLARLDRAEEEWEAHHEVRRFIRPILMRDPLLLPKPPTVKPEDETDTDGDTETENETSADAAVRTPRTEQTDAEPSARSARKSSRSRKADRT